ncbi:MAG: fasciclin domain-containing protein [Planctomycetes bacterium]|nr:fasciclin domain-containing protein [Planctomycetota bacterium]
MKTFVVGLIAFAGIAAFGSAKSVAAEPGKDIVTTAVAAGEFKTLAIALEKAGLVDTLKGKGPFTVFAPTDKAFAKIPEATLKAVLADKEKLTKILMAHVVVGKSVKASDVTKLDGAKVNGFTIATKDGVKIGTATVTKADIECSNGVIHVIDTVLIPD